MATIGSFTKSENGDYAGSVKTLTLNVKARITPVDKANDKAPDFRIYAGRSDIEFGASVAENLERRPRVSLGQARRSELPGPDLRLAGRGRRRPLADLVAPQRRLTAIKLATPRPPGGAFASSSIMRCEPAASAFRRDPSGLVPRPFARRPAPGAIGFVFRSHSKKAARLAHGLSAFPPCLRHATIGSFLRWSGHHTGGCDGVRRRCRRRALCAYARTKQSRVSGLRWRGLGLGVPASEHRLRVRLARINPAPSAPDRAVRRNPAVADTAASSAGGEVGPVVFADPSQAAPDAFVAWLPTIARRVLRARCTLAVAANAGNVVALSAFRAMRSAVIGADGVPVVTMRRHGCCVGLMAHGWHALARPAAVTFEVEGLDELAGGIDCLRTLQRLLNPAACAGMPATVQERLRQALLALDGSLAGASYRQIATTIFGEDRVSEEWSAASRFLKERVRRLVAKGHALMNGGYRDLIC